MPPSPTEVVRSFYAVVERSYSVEDALPELAGLIHPDGEYVNPPDALEPGVRRGLDGWRAAIESGAQGLGRNARFDIRETEERGNRVLAEIAIRTGGTASGVEVDGPLIGSVLTVEDGLIRRMEWFWRPEDARARFEAGD
jgi:ketosteroid isomerase-like protein